MAFLDDLATRLVTQNVGVLGTSIFLSSRAAIPTGNGPYLSLIETGGTGSVKTQNGFSIQRPSAQLLSRASTYPTARTMLKAAYDALGGANGLYNVLIGSTFYQSIVARQEPTDLGLDGAGRVMIVFNVDGNKQPS